MKSLDNYIWSYPFLYYMTLRHYQKEGGLPAKFAHEAGVMIPTVILTWLYYMILLAFQGHCIDIFRVKIFSIEHNFYNGLFIYACIYLFHLVIFSRARAKKIESYFDSLPKQKSSRARTLSILIFFISVAVCISIPLKQIGSDYSSGKCPDEFYKLYGAEAKNFRK